MACDPQSIVDDNPSVVAYFGPIQGATIAVLQQAADATDSSIVLGDPDAPFIFGDPTTGNMFGIP